MSLPDWMYHLVGNCNYSIYDKQQDCVLANIDLDRYRLMSAETFDFTRRMKVDAQTRLTKHRVVCASVRGANA